MKSGLNLFAFFLDTYVQKKGKKFQAIKTSTCRKMIAMVEKFLVLRQLHILLS